MPQRKRQSVLETEYIFPAHPQFIVLPGLLEIILKPAEQEKSSVNENSLPCHIDKMVSGACRS